MFIDKPLGNFIYKIIEKQTEITEHLRRELKSEWLQDQQEHPDQPWTPRWLEEVRNNNFELRRVNIAHINPLLELMNWKTESYSFKKELESRVAEARESLKMTRTIEPLVILKDKMELIDGYMRYTFLAESGEQEVYAYVSV